MIKIAVPILEKTFFVYTKGEEEPAKAKLRTLYGKNEKRDAQLDDNAGMCVGSVLFIGDNTINTLAHEVYHAMVGLAEYTGIDDEETTAYLIGYFMEKACKKLDIIWRTK